MAFNWDSNIFLFINHLPHSNWGDLLASTLHILTAGSLIYYGCIIFLLIRRKWHPASIWFSTLVITSIIVTIVKNLVHRIRPYQTLQNVLVGIPLPTSFSFPSGETATAFATAVCLCFLIKNKTARYLLFVYAFLIAFERIYMGHHYPTDIVAGALIGSLISYLIVKNLFKFWNYKKDKSQG